MFIVKKNTGIIPNARNTTKGSKDNLQQGYSQPSVDASVPLKKRNKIFMGAYIETKCGAETGNGDPETTTPLAPFHNTDKIPRDYLGC